MILAVVAIGAKQSKDIKPSDPAAKVTLELDDGVELNDAIVARSEAQKKIDAIIAKYNAGGMVPTFSAKGRIDGFRALTAEEKKQQEDAKKGTDRKVN
jgi:hypothetical protein